jgi:tellurite methyltransferase
MSWNNFYETFKEDKPSDFARTCFLINYFAKGRIVDIGCGNGRDALYFKRKGFNVVGVDLVDLDLRLDGFIKGIDELIKTDEKFENAYCRFLLHSISERKENKLLKWIYENCKYVFIEARSDKGVCPNDGKKRRLINARRLINKMIDIGFKIEYFDEATGLSKYKGENPVLIRIKAKV